VKLFKNFFHTGVNSEESFYRLLYGSSVSLFIKIIGLFVAYLFAFTVTTFKGAEAWGTFSLSLSLLIFGSIIGTAGFDTFLLKKSSSLKSTSALYDCYHRSSRLSFLFSSLAAATIYLLSDQIARYVFQSPELTPSLKIAALAILPYTFININAGVLQGLKKLKKFVFLRFLSHHLGGLILFLALIYFLDDLFVVILSYTLSLYLIAALSFFWIYQEKLWILSTQKTPLNSKKLLVKSSPFMVAALLFFMKGWIDTLMIGMFMESTDVGIYNIALKLTALLGITLSAVSAVSMPEFSEAYSSNNVDKLKESVQRSSAIVFYSSLPIFLFLLLFPDQILSLFGTEFLTGKTAFTILLIGGFVNAYFGLAGYFMKMTGCQVALQNITMATVFIGVILNLLLIPKFRIDGAAYATVFSILIWNLLVVGYIKKKFDIFPFYIPDSKFINHQKSQ
jgi:O-antigen/teichoic acid export membrane protein